tara:strand:- start:140 stop:415 length:276 start_codon:yes stop_codon:yes gene_type:complete
MAFLIADLSLYGQDGTDAPKQFMYTSADTAATINTSGYFDDVADRVRVNDLITVVSSTGGTPVHSTVIVNSNTGGVVDVSDGLVITATDTD